GKPQHRSTPSKEAVCRAIKRRHSQGIQMLWSPESAQDFGIGGREASAGRQLRRFADDAGQDAKGESLKGFRRIGSLCAQVAVHGSFSAVGKDVVQIHGFGGNGGTRANTAGGLIGPPAKTFDQRAKSESTGAVAILEEVEVEIVETSRVGTKKL